MNHKGFTIIETIIGIALLAAIFGTLGTAIYRTVQVFLDANDYKTAADYTFEHIQSTDDHDKKNDTNWRFIGEFTKSYKKNGVPQSQSSTTNDPIQVTSFESGKTIAKNQVKLNTYTTTIGDNKAKITYTFLEDVTDQYSTKEMDDLADKGITSYDDLPDPSYNALNTADPGKKSTNDEWGKWSFVGWSGGKLKKYTDTHEFPYKYYYTGDITVNSNQNPYRQGDWEGLVTRENFNDYINFINTKFSINPNYKPHLTATYIFSKDVADSPIEAEMLLGDPTDPSKTQSTRKQRDIDNLKNLASKAAAILKDEKGTLKNNFKDPEGLKAVTGDGIEILHFRENGWPVLAQNMQHSTYWWGNDIYDSYYSSGVMDVSDYEKSNAYNSYYKIGTKDNYTGGIKPNDTGTNKTGFLDRVFYEGIGFNLGKCGDYANDHSRWKGINYEYNTLLFGNDILTDPPSNGKKAISDSYTPQTLSLYMKINQESRRDGKYGITVTVWVGTFKDYHKDTYYMKNVDGYRASAFFVSSDRIY